jgi:phosphomannomutase
VGRSEVLDRIVKAYDVRGIAGTELTEEVAESFGIAFARFAGAGEVVVGRDCRLSSEPLSRAFCSGLAREGVRAIDIGLCSTDMLYYASGKLDRPGAMFTASHNPPDYNGIKFCGRMAAPIGVDTGLLEIKAIAARVLDEAITPTSGQAATPLTERVDILEDFAQHVRSFIAKEDLRPLRVVADCANGMAGLVAPKVFEGLPVELKVLFGELDGTFPNHPADPIQPENLKWLVESVVSESADLGLAFDGDADRVFIVDDRGEPLSGSTTTAMVARYMLEKHPGATILYNVICSRAVPEVIREAGGKPVVTRVGHSYIKEVMARTGAVFGGEHSGHYYFLDNYRADSGIIAAVIVLAIVSRDGRRLSEIRKDFERYVSSGEINEKVADPARVAREVVRLLKSRGMAVEELDGASVDAGRFWFNVRPSNTEPLIRINVEAENHEALREGLSFVREALEEAKRAVGT